MYDNHTNHASFMSNVFKLNDFELMSNVIIWVYHTCHDQGFSYDDKTWGRQDMGTFPSSCESERLNVPIVIIGYD